MKKILFVALAAVGLAACSTDDVVSMDKGDAIGFGNAFVDNSTKAIYENGTVPTSFNVWGNVIGQSTVALYGDTGATVTGTGKNTLYTCSEVRYWTPSCKFNFAAIAHGTAETVENGLPTVISYTADGSSDLLYASASAETDATGIPTGTLTLAEVGSEKVVAFTFKHLLSRVAFKFTVNANLDEDYTYDVTDVKIAGAFASGVCTPVGVWSKQTGTMTNPLTFGNVTSVETTGTAASGAYVIIPGTPELTITFNAVCKLNGTEVETYPYSYTLSTQTFEANKSYTFVAELPVPGNEIKFTVVDVTGFTDGSEVTIE